MNKAHIISSDLTDLDALKLELAEAKIIVKNSKAQDVDFGRKQYKMSGNRLFLVNETKKWEAKVDRLDKIIIDFKNDEKARAKKAKWAEIKAKAGYGGDNG